MAEWHQVDRAELYSHDGDGDGMNVILSRV